MRRGRGLVILNLLSIFVLVDEEFGEIVRNVLVFQVRVVLQVFKNRMRIGPIDLDLFQDRKLDVSFVREFSDFFCGCRLLIIKLIAREGEDLEALRTMGFVHLHKLFIIDGRFAAL